jgi:anhydro-N-acetylmuramic acid kinase
VRRYLPRERSIDRVMMSGGGTRNGLLWALLSQAFNGVPMARTDTDGIPADTRKALGFGVLAALTLDGIAASVPSATGAVASRVLGSLTPGTSSSWARCLAWMAAQTAHRVRIDEEI